MNRRLSQTKKEAPEKNRPFHNATYRRYSKGDRLKKTIPKAGMIGSIGSLVFTGFCRFKGAKTLHLWSGVALVGFSVWHYMQKRPRTKKYRIQQI